MVTKNKLRAYAGKKVLSKINLDSWLLSIYTNDLNNSNNKETCTLISE